MRFLPVLFTMQLLLLTAARAQEKPALPHDYFEKYSYTLPDTFNYKNEQALRAEVIKVATSLDAYLQIANTRYTIDSTELYDIISTTVAPALTLNKYAPSLEAINKCRALKPAPAYRAPFALIHEAYANE